MFEVEYYLCGPSNHYKRGFTTFEAAEAWAREHCSGWWAVSRYYE